MQLIRHLKESDWPQVDFIQNEVYPSEAIEDIEALKCHNNLSPETCFVATEGNALIAYLLAHPWKKRTQPPINTIYRDLGVTDSIYIHDIAITKQHQRTGLGHKLALKLFDVGLSLGYKSYCLISVQDSRLFWENLGFKVVTDLPFGYFSNIVNLYPGSRYYYMERGG